MSTESNLGAVISHSQSISGGWVQSCKEGERDGEYFLLLPNTFITALQGKNPRQDKPEPALI